jgi:hypothetical protein
MSVSAIAIEEVIVKMKDMADGFCSPGVAAGAIPTTAGPRCVEAAPARAVTQPGRDSSRLCLPQLERPYHDHWESSSIGTSASSLSSHPI